MEYNWQHKDWPNFVYQPNLVDEQFLKFNIHYGQFKGHADFLNRQEKEQVLLNSLLSEAMNTSAIEGEYFSREDVFSSIKKNLGLKLDKPTANPKASGIGGLVVKNHNSYPQRLSQSMLFSWHKQLMSGYSKIKVGQWRTGKEPMQVVSGQIGKEIIHFEAPPSSMVQSEMRNFIHWFNETAPKKNKQITNPLVRSAITHLYFETIHPFEDGNGRIGRALSEKALAQSIGNPVMFSLSKQIEKDKKAYYQALKEAQSSLVIDSWLWYFSSLILQAQKNALDETSFIIKKTRFFDKHKDNINARQHKILSRMLEEGPKGFEGGMTAKKYMSITKASKATATRDLQDLNSKGLVSKSGSGRSINYTINLEQ